MGAIPLDDADFRALMNLEAHGPDAFLGISPKYPWGDGVFGGQVVAQALRAACATVDDKFRVHSLHSYFIRSGDSKEPIRYEVDRIRNGRSFLTRRVVARQSVGPILNLSASFQIREDQADVQECVMPADYPSPDELPRSNWGQLLERRMIPRRGGRCAGWLRVPHSDPHDEIDQACALAYASDDIPLEANANSHPARLETSGGIDSLLGKKFIYASLDHSIWFHRPAPHNEWVLHDFQSHGIVGARGLSVGQIYNRQGVHLATVAQEVLLRERSREPAETHNG